VAEQFTGGGVDDAHVAVGDEHDDAGSGVFVAEADVVEAAGVAKGDPAGLVDAVVADPVVAIGATVRGGFGSGGVGGGGDGSTGERAVRPVLVVDVGEDVEESLELGDGGRGRLSSEPGLEGVLEAFDLAAGAGVVGSGVLLDDAEARQFDAGGPCWAQAWRKVSTTTEPLTRWWAVMDRA
jgi:hypothetical protein